MCSKSEGNIRTIGTDSHIGWMVPWMFISDAKRNSR